MKNLKVLFTVLCVACATTVWGAEVTLASWTFESGTAGTNYPSNKTNFSATAGICTSSTFYLNGTGSTWNTTKGWAFTAVTDVQITIKAATTIAKGSQLTFSVTAYYNKASNAPMKGFSLTCKEGSGDFSTTGLSATSWSLSTSSTANIVTYTTQNDIEKDGTICLKLTQTGKAGTGQGYMGPISVTMSESSGSGETTHYNVQWMVGGQKYTEGNPTTSVASGERVTNLPTAPADNSLSCAEKFMGWSAQHIGTKPQDDAPADLFTTIDTSPFITQDTTFYAVFATPQ